MRSAGNLFFANRAVKFGAMARTSILSRWRATKQRMNGTADVSSAGLFAGKVAGCGQGSHKPCEAGSIPAPAIAGGTIRWMLNETTQFSILPWRLA